MKILIILAVYCFAFVSCGQMKSDPLVKSSSDQDRTNENRSTDISDSTNVLTDKVETLEVEYTVWGCACPNWIRTADAENPDTTKSYLSLHFYIEPATKSLVLPSHFDAYTHTLKLTGSFYQREDYPQGTIELEEPLPKAKVFRYTSIELVQRGIRDNE